MSIPYKYAWHANIHRMNSLRRDFCSGIRCNYAQKFVTFLLTVSVRVVIIVELTSLQRTYCACYCRIKVMIFK